MILLSIGLTVVAICIAIFIALTQRIQLNRLKEIETQTKDTTEKLKTETLITKVVSDFFWLADRKTQGREVYKCIFPVQYKRKPLPFINQGDFYAVQVLDTHLSKNELIQTQ